MGRHAPGLEISAIERDTLERRVRARTSSQQAALRARVVLLAADGVSNTAIGTTLGIARHTAQRWRDRFLTQRLDCN
jgi:transposase-like protein